MGTLEIEDRGRILRRHPGRRWGTRQVQELRGLVVHQSHVEAEVEELAVYYTSFDNHVDPQGLGLPTIPFNYVIDPKGWVIQCVEPEEAIWSVSASVGDLNRKLLSVCLLGAFAAPSCLGGGEPTQAQILSLLTLWAELQVKFHLEPGELWGHHNFDDSTCPGSTITALIESYRLDQSSFRTLLGRKAALVDLGYLGQDRKGSESWGIPERRALVSLQKFLHIKHDGVWGPEVSITLARFLRLKGRV